MRIRMLVSAAAILASLLPAQNRPQPSQADLQKLRSEKLAKPVFQKAPWVLDFDKARDQAKREGKLLFTYFTRSYAH